jgi:hypothetical protein
MTTTMELFDTSRPAQYLYLEDVSWECYEMLMAAGDTSDCFGFLNADDINCFLDRRDSVPETSLLRQFRDWIRQGI